MFCQLMQRGCDHYTFLLGIVVEGDGGVRARDWMLELLRVTYLIEAPPHGLVSFFFHSLLVALILIHKLLDGVYIYVLARVESPYR